MRNDIDLAKYRALRLDVRWSDIAHSAVATYLRESDAFYRAEQAKLVQVHVTGDPLYPAAPLLTPEVLQAAHYDPADPLPALRRIAASGGYVSMSVDELDRWIEGRAEIQALRERLDAEIRAQSPKKELLSRLERYVQA